MRTHDDIIDDWEKGVLNRGELYGFLLEVPTPENLPDIKKRLGEETDLWKRFEVIVKNDELPEDPPRSTNLTRWQRFCHWVRWG